MKKAVVYSIEIIMSRILNIFTKMKKDRILFLSDVRKELGGNLKEMDNYINSNDYEKIYCLKENRQKKRSLKEKYNMMKKISTSKYILLDDFCSTISMIKRRKNQEIIQLWHGPGAYKTFGLSRNDKKISGLKKLLTHRNYTHALVTSEEIKWCFAEGFGMEEKSIFATGYPRTDMFFDKKYISSKKEELLKKYPEFKNKKVIMFAPTYRGNSLPHSYYDFDNLDVDQIYKELNKDYVFIIKWHPGLISSNERDKFEKQTKKYPKFYYDFTSYRDINDLLLITDCLVTDYSSVIFDYLLVNKPIVYFAYDRKEYEDGRGLYYPFKDYIYGEVAINSNELVKCIKSNNMMDKERKEFNKKFMNACDGNATKKTFEAIFKNKY